MVSVIIKRLYMRVTCLLIGGLFEWKYQQAQHSNLLRSSITILKLTKAISSV